MTQVAKTRNALSSDEKRDLILSVGTHKRSRRLPPVGVAKLMDRALKLNTIDELARDLGFKETSTIKKFLSLLDLPSEIQAVTVWGRTRGYLSFSVASQISRVGDPSAMNVFCRAALEHGLNKEEARAIAQCHKRAGDNIETCVNSIVKLRPMIEHQHMFIGKIDLEKIGTSAGSARSELRKNLARIVGPSNVLSVSIKDSRYIFLLKDEAIIESKVISNLSSHDLDKFVVDLVCHID